MKEQAIVMLSGGKDSCALTYQLSTQGIPILPVTVDTGFLSDVAKDNIDKLIRYLNLEHLYIRPKSKEYKDIIDQGLGMISTCKQCSAKTAEVVLRCAKIYGIKYIYAGFTKYTAVANGWPLIPEQTLDGITVIYPYYETYEISVIKEICNELNLEFDPTKTNCKYIKELIDRGESESLLKEAHLLLTNKQINEEEFQYYRDFLKSGGKNGT